MDKNGWKKENDLVLKIGFGKVLAKVCLKPECDQWMIESINRFMKSLNKILYENFKLLEVDLWESFFQV